MEIKVLRNLDLAVSAIDGLPAHVAAASGLVKVGEWLHVVPDDALALASFTSGTADGGRAHVLFSDGSLPSDEKERKALKPDLESLALVPYQGGKALLALGSGSTPARRRGILQRLLDSGEVDGPPRVFDLAPLYASLPFKELNIEGLAAVGNTLYLGQRGNSQEGRNALVALDLPAALTAIYESGVWNADLMKGEPRALDLGDILGVRLTLTDLTPFDNEHLLLSAAAEATANPYDDGAVLGSVLGKYSLTSGTLTLLVLEGPWKVEGVERLDDGRILMVTDGDDPHLPALLLEVSGVTL